MGSRQDDVFVNQRTTTLLIDAISKNDGNVGVVRITSRTGNGATDDQFTLRFESTAKSGRRCWTVGCSQQEKGQDGEDVELYSERWTERK